MKRNFGNIPAIILILVTTTLLTFGLYTGWKILFKSKPVIIRSENPVKETGISTVTPAPTQIIKNNNSPICNSNYEKYYVGGISGYDNCGNYNYLKPKKLLMDMPSVVVDNYGAVLDVCGGMPGPNGPNLCQDKYVWSESCQKIGCD